MTERARKLFQSCQQNFCKNKKKIFFNKTFYCSILINFTIHFYIIEYYFCFAGEVQRMFLSLFAISLSFFFLRLVKV